MTDGAPPDAAAAPTTAAAPIPEKKEPDVKTRVAIWCARMKWTPAAYNIRQIGGNLFEGQATLTFPDGTRALSKVYRGQNKRLIEFPAAEDILAAITERFGPELPNPVQKLSSKARRAKQELRDWEAKRRVEKEAYKREALLCRRASTLRGLHERALSLTVDNARSTLNALVQVGLVRSFHVRATPARPRDPATATGSCVCDGGASIHLETIKADDKKTAEKLVVLELVRFAAKTLLARPPIELPTTFTRRTKRPGPMTAAELRDVRQAKRLAAAGAAEGEGVKTADAPTPTDGEASASDVGAERDHASQR